MKKFLFALMGIIISLPSWAAVDQVWESYGRIWIGFNSNTFDVNDAYREYVVQGIKKYKDITKIVIIGSADSVGNDASNITLAKNRAKAVENILINANYSPGLIETYVAGEANARAILGDRVNELTERSAIIYVIQDHVGAICSNEKVRQAISQYPNELRRLDDACKAGLDNNKIIEILVSLDPSYGLGDIANAYKLYAELLKDTEDLRLDTSVWRTADGKFNTARLASDSIAGVVLGTVGGVVTSTIMKKSQVRNGLEDLKCVIGGQTVASYDDQFSVGLK